MALALWDAATLKPEVQLSRALRDFESVLNVTQKQQLDLYKLETAPGSDAPLKLASWLDRTLRARRSRRCMGPRVVNLLQGTQQFASVIDGVSEGSQSPIASGVWGALKLALWAGMEYSAYFDKLTRLLMEVGRTCPRYEEIKSLLTESQNLRKAIYSYFAAVIDLCRCIISFQPKPFWAKLPGIITPFDASFLQVKARIERLAVEIRNEVKVATIQHQKQKVALRREERTKNARHRTAPARFREDTVVEVQKKEKHRVRNLEHKFLRLLSDHEQSPAWKQAYSRGTVRWILTLCRPALNRSLATRYYANIFRPDATEKEVFEEQTSACSAEKEAITPKAAIAAQIDLKQNIPLISGSFFQKWFSRPREGLLVYEDIFPTAELAASCYPPAEMSIELDGSVQFATEPLPLEPTQKRASFLQEPSACDEDAVLRQDARTFGVAAAKLKDRFQDEPSPPADGIATSLNSPALVEIDSPTLVELYSPVTVDYHVTPHRWSDKIDSEEVSPRRENPVDRAELPNTPLMRRTPRNGLSGKSQLRINIPKPNLGVIISTSTEPMITTLEELEESFHIQEPLQDSSSSTVQLPESKLDEPLATNTNTKTSLDACEVSISGKTEEKPPKVDADVVVPEPIDISNRVGEDNETEEMSTAIRNSLSEDEITPFSPGLSSAQFSGFNRHEETPRTSISSVRSASTDNLPDTGHRQDTFDHQLSPSDFKFKMSPPSRGRLRRRVKRGVHKRPVQHTKKIFTRRASWWENPLLIFLVFVLWPSIMVCFSVYYSQNLSRMEEVSQQRMDHWYSILRAFGI